MQPSQVNSHKRSKFLDLKVFIGVFSMAITIGFWNLFSTNAFALEKASPNPIINPPPQPPVGESQDLSSQLAIPTLVPLVSVSSLQPVKSAVTQQTLPLRAAAAPTQVIVQKVKPVFYQPVQVINGGGGGGSGGSSVGGAPAAAASGGSASPVTTTQSSR
jgi:hypothetical protein